MEWTMPVNDYLRDEITKIDHNLVPPGLVGDVRTIRLVQDSMGRVIDNLGRASASAQGLSKVITTADKLRKAPTHILYLLKDPLAKGGSGEVIGLLKVGRKHLYLSDESGRMREAEPLCVLDFYVLGDRQRHGHGRVLFDHMLQDTSTLPHTLAIDGPSLKMENFLIKNYNLGKLIRQNNNFAVCPQFFEASTDIVSASTRAGTPASAPVTAPAPSPAAVGRFTAHKPHSTIASVIHGGDADHGAGAGTTNGTPEPETTTTAESSAAEPESDVQEECVAGSLPAARAEHPATATATVKRPQWLGLGEPGAATAPPAAGPRRSPASLERRDSQLTTQGYFDVKFYHNKLW